MDSTLIKTIIGSAVGGVLSYFLIQQITKRLAQQ